MANQDDQNPNENIINPPNQPMVQANQPFQNRQRGTGFTNINRILGANVGAGQKLAGRIGGAIAGQGQRVRQNLGQAQQQFQTGFQQARQGALANIEAASGLTKQPGESDEQYEARVAGQSPDYGQIGQNLRTTSYQGPTGFENPNMLLSQAQTAGRLGTFARSGMGQGILARQYGGGRGNYGIGQNILDQMLLSQDPNAQRMLQQSRQGVVGLGEGVQSAAEAAQTAAEATQTGIEAAKGKAAEDIMKSTQGILARGGQSATEFNAQMEGMKRLLMGVDEAGNPITEITPQQQALLDKMDEYGLANVNLYSGRGDVNENEIKGIMNQLAAGMVLNPSGSLKLSDTQRQAALNLARLQNDPTLQQKMLENKFDTRVFKKDVSKLSQDINQNLAKDKETRDILMRAGQYMKGQEDIVTNRNQVLRDAKLEEIRSSKMLTDAEKRMLENDVNKEFEYAQRDLLEGTPIDWSRIAWGGFLSESPNAQYRARQAEQEILNKIYKEAGIGREYGFRGGFDYDEALGKTVGEGLKSAIGGNYGWLPFGDRSADIDYGGADSIDPRFRGLGLTGTAGRGSGGLRTSRDFLSAAEKAVGKEKTLKERILERITKNRSNL